MMNEEMEAVAEAALNEAMETDQDDSKILDAQDSVEDITTALEDLPPEPSTVPINKLQDEMQNIDILVCGRCHHVFYFVEDLQLHKADQCTGVSDVTAQNKADSKSEVWAFVLYKATKLRDQNHIDWSASPWRLYQMWSKLDPKIKQAWVEAGKAVQEQASYLPQAQIKSEFQKTPGPKATAKIKQPLTAIEREQEQQTLIALQRQLEDGESQMMNTLGLVRESKKDFQLGPNQMWKKRKGTDNEEELLTIEKIVAKRVNPKNRHPEYLVKWEGSPSDQNTWEPVQDLSNCMKMIQEFEKSLAKQKARKALEASKMANKNIIRVEDVPQSSPGGRPQRSSAKKALDQVKEWVGIGSKRRYDSDDESEDDTPTKHDTAAELTAILKRKATPSGKPVLVANSKGVVRVDPKAVPNLTSGVYILSTQSGLIKIEEPTASKLTEVMKIEGRKLQTMDNKTMMINETEVRKISASNALPKLTMRKEFSPTPTIIRKDNNSSLKMVQKVRSPSSTPIRLGTPIRQQQSSALSRQIILGKNKPRPLPGPVPSPFRPPLLKQKIPQATRTITIKEKLSDDDFDGGLPDEFPKDDDPIAPASPTRPLTLCPQTGEVLGRAEGERTPPPDDEMVVDGDDIMRVEMSPGGTLRQIVQHMPQRPKQQRSLLNQRRQAKIQEEEEQEMISLDGSENVLYITPEQQQMLLQNGTLTMHDKSDEVSTVVLPQESMSQEQTELLINNGQIVERHLVSDVGDGENSNDEPILIGGQTFVEEGEDGVYSNVLTLDSAVQEAISPGGVDQSDASKGDENQLVAQIIQADPPTPGGGPRKVVLLLPDGSLVNTEMTEDEYQALEMDK